MIRIVFAAVLAVPVLVVAGDTPHPSEPGKAAAAQVAAMQWGSQVRHRVRVTNTSRVGSITAIVVGQSPGITGPLLNADLPEGWRYKMVEGATPERWAVFLSCDPAEWPADGADKEAPARQDHGFMVFSVKPGESAQFDLFLSYRSAGLLEGPVVVAFDDRTIVQARR